MYACTDFEEADVDILILTDYFGGCLPQQVAAPSYDHLTVCILYDSISVSRPVDRIRGPNGLPSSITLGPIDVQVTISQRGRKIVDSIPTFRKAIALLRYGFDREAIPFILRLQLAELSVFLSHKDDSVRDAAIMRYNELVEDKESQ